MYTVFHKALNMSHNITQCFYGNTQNNSEKKLIIKAYIIIMNIK